MTMDGSSLWRILAISLITLLTGVAGTWATVGSDKPTRAEVREMIKNEAPSSAQIEDLRNQIVDLKIEQARTTEKLDLLLKKLNGGR